MLHREKQNENLKRVFFLFRGKTTFHIGRESKKKIQKYNEITG
jgi:hypothetical protein